MNHKPINVQLYFFNAYVRYLNRQNQKIRKKLGTQKIRDTKKLGTEFKSWQDCLIISAC